MLGLKELWNRSDVWKRAFSKEQKYIEDKLERGGGCFRNVFLRKGVGDIFAIRHAEGVRYYNQIETGEWGGGNVVAILGSPISLIMIAKF